MASVRASRPCPCRRQQWNRLPPISRTPPQNTVWLGSCPASSAASATATLNVDPGAYRPRTERSTSGVVGLLLRAFHVA